MLESGQGWAFSGTFFKSEISLKLTLKEKRKKEYTCTQEGGRRTDQEEAPRWPPQLVPHLTHSTTSRTPTETVLSSIYWALTMLQASLEVLLMGWLNEPTQSSEVGVKTFMERPLPGAVSGRAEAGSRESGPSQQPRRVSVTVVSGHQSLLSVDIRAGGQCSHPISCSVWHAPLPF